MIRVDQNRRRSEFVLGDQQFVSGRMQMIGIFFQLEIQVYRQGRIVVSVREKTRL